MKIDTPFFITKKGKGWRNAPRYTTLRYLDGSEVEKKKIKKKHLRKGPFVFVEGTISGYYEKDGEKIRITNLVGYNGKSFLKYCPNCKKIKPIKDFDYSGRTTDNKRDQSNCSKCRSRYEMS